MIRNILSRLALGICLLCSLSACGDKPPTSILEVYSTESVSDTNVQPVPVFDLATFEETECPFQMPQRLPEARFDVQCGFLSTPENRREVVGSKIRLAVAIYKSQAENPKPDPLLILTGGGGPFLQFSMYMTFLFNQVYEQRDLILIDERGTGYSEPALRCPGLNSAFYETLNLDPYSTEVKRQAVELRQACLQSWKSKEIQWTAYTTAESAADLAELRTALGIRQWNVYALGYSTRLAFELARNDPQGVRSMILDTAIPPQVEYFAESAASAKRALDLLFSRCAADERCAEAFPDLENTFYDLVDQLNTAPQLVEVPELSSGQRMNVLLTGDRLIETVLMALDSIFDENLLPELPRMIFQLNNGRYDTFKMVFSAVHSNMAPMDEGRPELLLCNEELLLTPTEKIQQLYRQTNPQLAGYYNRRLDFFTEICETLRFPELPSGVKAPVSSGIPTLFLSGDLATNVPPAWASLAANYSGQSFHIQFQDVGPFVAASPKYRDCTQGILSAFLDDPTIKPDSTCASARREFLWITLP